MAETDNDPAHVAIQSFLLGRRKPDRFLLPDPGWPQAAHGDASGNIQKMWAASAYGYGDQVARTRWLEIGEIEKTRYMLSEPNSTTYGDWIVMSDVTVLGEAEARKDHDVVDAIEPLVRQWFGTAHMVSGMCPHGNLDDAAKQWGLGRRICPCSGCRAWGHGQGLGIGTHEAYRVAFGLQQPNASTKWTNLARKKYLGLMRAVALQFAGKSPDEIVKLMPQYGSRAPFEYYFYEDGSRVTVMGMNEEKFVDEDRNSNTPGFLITVMDYGRDRLFIAPEWPNPRNGDQRIRQQGVQADIDRAPGGWILRHSEIGHRFVDGYWITEIEEPKARLVTAWRSPQETVGWMKIDAAGNAVGSSLPIPTAPAPTTRPPQHQGGGDKRMDNLGFGDFVLDILKGGDRA